MKKCTNCGETNPDEAQFCKKCGKKMEDEYFTRGIIIAVISFIGLLFGLYLFYLALTTDEQSHSPFFKWMSIGLLCLSVYGFKKV